MPMNDLLVMSILRNNQLYIHEGWTSQLHCSELTPAHMLTRTVISCFLQLIFSLITIKIILLDLKFMRLCPRECTCNYWVAFSGCQVLTNMVLPKEWLLLLASNAIWYLWDSFFSLSSSGDRLNMFITCHCVLICFHIISCWTPLLFMLCMDLSTSVSIFPSAVISDLQQTHFWTVNGSAVLISLLLIERIINQQALITVGEINWLKLLLTQLTKH